MLNKGKLDNWPHNKRTGSKCSKLLCMQNCFTFSLIILGSFFCSPKILLADMTVSQGKFIGNIFKGNVDSDFATYWNQVTPENAGKWGSVESTRGSMNWEPLDVMFEYARDKSFPVKQHNFIFGLQQPDWMNDLPADEQKVEVEEWIRAFCERYPDVQYIDVVNEPINKPPSYRMALGGAGNTGWDWVIWAFEKTRESCPNSQLLVNEINIERDYSSMTQYMSLIQLLRDRRLVDGIGVEGHFLEGSSSSEIKTSLDRLATLGLPIYISELDIEGDDNTQLSVFQRLFPVMWEHPGVYGITFWGYKQNQLWRPNAYLVRSDGSERPALIWLKSYLSAHPAKVPNPPSNVRTQ